MKNPIILFAFLLLFPVVLCSQQTDQSSDVSNTSYISNRYFIELGGSYLIENSNGNSTHAFILMHMPNRIKDYEIALNVGYDYWGGKHGLMLGYSGAAFFKNFYIRSELYITTSLFNKTGANTHAFLGGYLGYAFSLNEQMQNFRIELKTNHELIDYTSFAIGLSVLYSPNKKLLRY